MKTIGHHIEEMILFVIGFFGYFVEIMSLYSLEY